MNNPNAFAEDYHDEELSPEDTHWRNAFDSQFLRHFDLRGRPRIVTIATVPKRNVATYRDKSTESKMKITLAEFAKPWRTNVTNCELIEGLYGADPHGWIGKRIELYPTKTRGPSGAMVDCIRVRDKVPDEPRPQNDTAKRAKAELSDAVKRHLDSMAAAQDADQLDACAEALVADDTLSEAETTFLGKALEKRRGQLRVGASHR